MISILLSVIVGFIFGSLYGLLFVYQRRAVLLSFSQSIAPSKKYLFLIAFAFVRLLFIGAALLFIFKSSYLNFLLFIVTFLIGFWLIIFTSKAKHGRL